ncbi:hypothetical protein MMJ54_13255, partial [Enterococcus cecorum]|nr:hypothetical protein [Enterococcus cecorum]
MLQKFRVTGFKNFASTIEFDLTSGNYSFNNEAVKNNILTTAVIYGCRVYTSDDADEIDGVDVGGRRAIEEKEEL